ncbi:MAG TPA: c-type cytochrome biogenesis protein CcsB [Bacteroidales bacterium]|nr:c-type cytochrome biogenesis protein CcsB [Bacteroidales bacterium]
MKYLKFLISPAFMGILFVVFAASMAVATFVENDFGSAAAYGMVYNTRWFELILLLLAINLVGQLFMFRLFRRSRLTGALFHLSFIVMLAGAAITRYTGWEGSIRIREGEEQANCFTSDKFLGWKISDQNGTQLSSHSQKFSMNSSKAERFRKKISAGNSEYTVALKSVVPNASQELADDPDGKPVVSFIIMKGQDMSGDDLVLGKGDLKTANGITIGFESGATADLRVGIDSGRFVVSSAGGLSAMNMMTREVINTVPGQQLELKKMEVLTVKNVKIIVRGMSLSASPKPVAVDPSQENTGRNAYIFNIAGSGSSKDVYLWQDVSSDTASVRTGFDNKRVEITYGSSVVSLPFSIRLNDFILERYPGSNSPSGYKSDVTLLDKNENVEKPFMIFMNNILKYKGYRFYQSSYDRDEKGTVLSVNHDIAGMMVTYTGYALLFLFIILSMLNRNTLFHRADAGFWNSKLRKALPAILLFLGFAAFAQAQGQRIIPGRAAADAFGKTLVQDQKGRTKPLYTLSSDILRKVTKENKFEGLTPVQVFLGINLDFDHWKDVPLISIGNNDLRKKIGISGNRAAFSDIVNLTTGDYKISSEINSAYNKAPGERSKYDKELMKVDERVNIIYMIYNGSFVRLFPLRNGTQEWGSVSDALKFAKTSADSVFLNGIQSAMSVTLTGDNKDEAGRLAETVRQYQERFAGYSLPAASKTNAETLYYRLNIFEKLFPFYATIGLIMMTVLIIAVIKGKQRKSPVYRLVVWLLFAGFLFHTLGFGIRWYVSGHAPMSNGYESMIFISWVTLLAGFLFSRRSVFALPATSVLASMTLLVAHMSFMDPEITNLVPVLKSYWLTLHVSVITGSYSFLGFGAILGLISIILFSLANNKNRERISDAVDELTVLNYKTLTVGLYFLTIGTFLGAIWANESWGRYWGWDPKETWSLITIIVYSIVIHSRLIPGMKDIFTFNMLSLLAFSSVLMTYFGVNYYLSGLHSYASGDPVPVPSFVYITVIALAALILYANNKYRKTATN